jgi:hypothetical protein
MPRLGGDQGGPAEGDGDAHAGQDLGQGRLEDHVPHDLVAARAHGIGRVDLLDRAGADAGPRADRQRREAGEIDQHDLGEVADAEPDDRERQVGERRDRPVELDRRIEDAPGDAVDAHGDADRHGGDQRQEERAEDPVEACQDMLVQGVLAEALALGDDLGPGADEHLQAFHVVVVAGDLEELREHQPGRGQEQRPEQLQLGDQPPGPQDDDDGDRADQRALAGSGRPVGVLRLLPAAEDPRERHDDYSSTSSP